MKRISPGYACMRSRVQAIRCANRNGEINPALRVRFLATLTLTVFKRFEDPAMPTRRLPPLRALEAFIRTVRLGSARAAADEIGLSPSALSRQIGRANV